MISNPMQQGLKLVLLCLLLSACTDKPYKQTKDDGAPVGNKDFSQTPDAVPRYEPKSKYGNPPFYTVLGKRYRVMKSHKGYKGKGIASWYGTKFHGRRTSSGEAYDMFAMTAAHKTLPIPCYAKVTNLDTGKSIVVKINDRGPFHEGRIIDLSYAAAGKLGIQGTGTGNVQVETIDVAKKWYQSKGKTTPAKAPRLFLQVGAFSSLEKAESVKSRLGLSLRAPIRVKTLKDQWYRVQVGPMKSEDRAYSMVDRLDELGFSGARLIVE